MPKRETIHRSRKILLISDLSWHRFHQIACRRDQIVKFPDKRNDFRH